MKADPQWDRARAAAAKRGWHMPNNLACRADCEAMARAWFGDEVALARDKALDAAAWIADATADDLDDHPKAQAEARAIRDEILALREPKP